MTGRLDVIVIGAGPAGANAAITAAGEGSRVLLVDENQAAGGQVYRALPSAFRPEPAQLANPDFAAGEALRERLRDSSVESVFDHLVWSVAAGFRIDALGPAGPVSWQAPTLIVAPGTTERVIPFPGWTTPGVLGLAAATILLKSQKVLPGRRTVVAGVGPLLAAVSNSIVKGGGEVAAVVDLNGRRHWGSALTRMASRPNLVARGARWFAGVRSSGAPFFFQHTVRSVCTHDDELVVEIGPTDGEGAPVDGPIKRLRADALTVGHGLTPATEITRLLGAEHRFDAIAGGWHPFRNADLSTSVEGLFAVGDGAGLSGAAAAEIEGQLAGLAASHRAGNLAAPAYAALTKPLRRRLARASRFGRAVGKLLTIKPGLIDAVPRDALVCRCEDITRGEIENAIGAGARDVNQLKAWTRCGMGPCQGRLCGETAASLLARHVGDRERAGVWTARVPVRPVPLSTMVGDFDYDDIPLPGAAPL